MHLLALLITDFSISIAALVLDNSDLPRLPFLTASPPTSSSLDPETPGNEPRFSNENVNLGTTAFVTPDIPNYFTPSPNIAPGLSTNGGGLDSVSFKSTDIPNSFNFDPEIAQGQIPNVGGLDSVSYTNPDVHKLAQGPIANGGGLFISPFTNPDMSNAFTSDPNRGPIANSAGEPPTKYPSTTYTQAQIHNDYPDKMCLSHGFDDQKIQKKDQSGAACRSQYPLIYPPDPRLRQKPKGNAEPRTDPKEAENDEMDFLQLDWLDKVNRMSDDVKFRIFFSGSMGEEACKKQGLGVKEPIPFCCLGPEEGFTVPTLGQRRARRDVTLVNVYNCLQFLVGSPYCSAPRRIYCCYSWVGDVLSQWGVTALGCVKLAEDLATPLARPDPSQDPMQPQDPSHLPPSQE